MFHKLDKDEVCEFCNKLAGVDLVGPLCPAGGECKYFSGPGKLSKVCRELDIEFPSEVNWETLETPSVNLAKSILDCYADEDEGCIVCDWRLAELVARSS